MVSLSDELGIDTDRRVCSGLRRVEGGASAAGYREFGAPRLRSEKHFGLSAGDPRRRVGHITSNRD